ncbi:TcmI family type II polyketide cyclase [Plantactinospora sp. GCM10030261]|uniref:TcmI family type II polyketide cyclase n=1 Tax=Plantactinospora sp. GCM10030261 TaxID=3273420 RepID=UPI00360D12E9
MERIVVVSKLLPDSERELGGIFAKADATDLPEITGVRHRSLYQLGDLFVHLMETDAFDPARMAAARAHPSFREVEAALTRCTSPYLPTWQSPKDAMASRFYRWDAPGGTRG